MLELMGAVGPFGLGIFFIVLFLGIIFLMRFLIEKSSKDLISGKKSEDNIAFTEKKFYSVDLNKYKGLFSNIGWALSVSIVLVAFEYPDFDEQDLMDLGSVDANLEEIIEIPPTEQKPPPPPKIKQPEIIEVPDEEEIEEEMDLDLDMEVDEETVVEEIVEEEEEEEEVADQIFEIVEEPAAPIGGLQSFYSFVAKNMKYPKQARRMGIEGRVYIQFVIEKDGSVTDVKAVRGIGAGCDEEAIRVLKNAPKWKPGKQRGRPVRQRMIIPISFKLG